MDIGNLYRKITGYFQPQQQVVSPLAQPPKQQQYNLNNPEDKYVSEQYAKGSRASDQHLRDLYKQYAPKQAATPTPQVLAASTQRSMDNYKPSPTGKAGSGTSQWNDVVKLFIDEGNKRGYHGETVARQKALESAFGTSQFARERHNYGGIGAYDRDPNQAFQFASPQEYFDYYDKMVQKRFPDAYKVRNDPQQYVTALKKGNYASDPDYVWKVLHTPIYPG